MDHEFAAQMRLSQSCGAGSGIPTQSYRLMSDVDTTPPRIPDRLYNPLEAWPPSFHATPDPIIPKLELGYVHRKPVYTGDADPMHVPEGRLERLADRKLLRFGDDY